MTDRPDTPAATDTPRTDGFDPSDCPICGEWRDSPTADCGNCGWEIRPCGDVLGLCVHTRPHSGPHKFAGSWAVRLAASTPQVQADPQSGGPLRKAIRKLWTDADAIQDSQTGSQKARNVAAEALRQAAVEVERALLEQVQADPPAEGLPTSAERRRVAYVVNSLPHQVRLDFVREVARQIGYTVSLAATPAAKPEAGAGLDEERLAEALGRLYDDPVWENIDPWSREFAGMIAAAYAEAASPRSDAGSEHSPAIGLSSAGAHKLCAFCGEPWPCKTVRSDAGSER